MKLVDPGSQNQPVKVENKPAPSGGNGDENALSSQPTTATPAKAVEPMSDKKRNMLIIAIVIVICILAVLIKGVFFQPDDVEDAQAEPTKQEQVDKTEGDTEEKPAEEKLLSEIKDNLEMVRTKLERADAPVADAAPGKAHLLAGVEYLTALRDGNFNPEESIELSKTNDEIAKVMQILLLSGFTANIEGSEWFESNTEGVQQFAFVMTDGERDVAFAGNYLVESGLLNIADATDLNGVLAQIRAEDEAEDEA